jgi:hypothetical protein
MSQPKKLIRAEEAQVLLLDRMLTEMRKLRADYEEIKQIVKDQVPVGVTEPVQPITVTHDVKRVTPIKPWFNCSIVNDGPNSVKVIVNSEKSFEWHTVAKDETYRVDMGRPLIKDVLLQCNTGETADVRIVGAN